MYLGIHGDPVLLAKKSIDIATRNGENRLEPAAYGYPTRVWLCAQMMKRTEATWLAVIGV